MSKADLVIGIDCSTTASKAVVWDMTGRAVATGRRSYGQTHVRSGWVEQNAPDWWAATSAAIAEAVALVGSQRIAAIAITHQRETFVCLDKAGEPIRPAITWMDVRATAEDGLRQRHLEVGVLPILSPHVEKLELAVAEHFQAGLVE